MVKFNFTKTPEEVLEYLKSKGYKLTFDYNELQKQGHHRAFTVAKVTRLDLLHDIFNSIYEGIESGKGFKEWQRDIKPTLQKKGWWGIKDIINPSTGEIKTIKVDSHKLRNIYKTNMRVAYSKQRYESMSKLTLSVYWRYKSALLENTRDDHRKAHGTILHKSHPWWNTNYPPNGWGCVCKVQAYSKKQIEKKGWSITNELDENIASKDWSYNPADTKVSKISKLNLDNSLEALPNIKDIKRTDYAALSEEELTDKFFSTMAVAQGAMFIDKVNDPIIIDDSLFTTAAGQTKIKKQDRHFYIDEIAQTIKDPDEIYLEFEKLREDNKGRLVKKYFKYYKNENGAKKALIVLFEYQEDKTLGVSAYFINSSGTVEKKRFEKLIYQRDQGKN